VARRIVPRQLTSVVRTAFLNQGYRFPKPRAHVALQLPIFSNVRQRCGIPAVLAKSVADLYEPS